MFSNPDLSDDNTRPEDVDRTARMVNVALTFDADTRDRLFGYARRLHSWCEVVEAPLGRDAIPHITLAHIDPGPEGSGDIEALADRVWDEVSPFSSYVASVGFSGLRLVPSSSGAVWLEVSVLASSGLKRLQAVVLGTPLVRAATVETPTGDRFRPHVTLGYAPVLGSSAPPLDYPLLSSEDVPVRLAVSSVGERFSAPEILRR